MNDEQLQMQGAEIDERLFFPLAEFFEHDSYNQPDFDSYILKKGYPKHPLRDESRKARSMQRNAYRGFALDAYVKYALSRFTEITGCPLSPAELTTGTLPDGHTFKASEWGNVTFYNTSKYNTSKITVAEIDGLYEFKGTSQLTPVVFEVTFDGGGPQGNLMSKIKLVQYLYDSHPFFCKIRPAKGNERPGVYKRRFEHRRDIAVPKRNFSTLIDMLCYLERLRSDPQSLENPLQG